MVLAAMLFMGWAYAVVNPATARGILEWFPPRRRATAMGVKQAGVVLKYVLQARERGVAVIFISAKLTGARTSLSPCWRTNCAIPWPLSETPFQC